MRCSWLDLQLLVGAGVDHELPAVALAAGPARGVNVWVGGLVALELGALKLQVSLLLDGLRAGAGGVIAIDPAAGDAEELSGFVRGEERVFALRFGCGRLADACRHIAGDDR